MILINKKNISLFTLIIIFFISTMACTYGPQGVFSGIERERAIESVATGLPSTLGPSFFASTSQIEALAGPALYIRKKENEVWKQITIESEKEVIFGIGATGDTLYAAVLTESGERQLMYTDSNEYTDTTESISWTKVEGITGELLGIISINSNAFSWTKNSFYTLSISGTITERAIQGETGTLNTVDGAYNPDSSEYLFISQLQVFGGTPGALQLDDSFPGVTSGSGYEVGDFLSIVEYLGSNTFLIGTHHGRLFLFDGSNWIEPKSSTTENVFTWPIQDTKASYLTPNLTSSFYDPLIDEEHIYLGTNEGYDLLEVDISGKKITYKDASNLTNTSNQNSTAFSSTPVNEIYSVKHPYSTAYVIYVLSSNKGVWAATFENNYLEWQWLIEE